MQFFFRDQLRWNLGWETPNQGGAFVATLLPWLWWLTALAVAWGWRARGFRRWLGWGFAAIAVLGEAAASWALAKTYSRGALVAVLAAGVFWAGVGVVRRWRVRPGEKDSSVPESPAIASACSRADLARGGVWLAVRTALLAGCVLASGFGSRLEPAYTAADRSVLNRLDLWQGGLQLVAASPWHGWGWDNSGGAFMQWTQPVGRTEAYKSMVNSYLTVAVEGGLPLFAGALALAFALLLLGSRQALGAAGATAADKKSAGWRWRLRHGFGSVCLPATAGLVAWLAALLFSNLWIIRGLWIAPGVAALLVFVGNFFANGSSLPRGFAWLRGRWLRPIATASTAALLVAGSLMLAGTIISARAEVRVARSADGTVTISKRGTPASAPLVAVLPSPAVLGPVWGQELRRWAAASAWPLRLAVPPDLARLPPAPAPVVAFGEACGLPALQGRRVVLVHPLAPPVPVFAPAAGSVVVLPGIDLARLNPRWQEWAAHAGAEVRSSGRVALDVRARWPEAMPDNAW
jgi:O-antigen ligase